MSIEPHASAAGAGRPVDLDETVVLKAENVFAVSRRDGSLPVSEPHPLGVYADDCRFLSGHELRLAGARPRLLIASAAEGSESVHELTNPALKLPDDRLLPAQSMRIRFERRLAAGWELEESVLVRSYHREPLALQLDLLLAADFTPMLALRGLVAAAGAPARVEAIQGGLRFATRGRDGLYRATSITADRPAERLTGEPGLRFALALPPGGEAAIALRYGLHEGEAPAPARPPRAALTRLPAAAWLAGRTTVTADDERFNQALKRSLLDLRMLRSRLGGDEYCAAGVPWFATLFGRDSLICAQQLLAFDPALAAQTLRVLARFVATADDPEHDAEPGKVLHELRAGEVARLGLSPFARYYGSVDATPLFLCLLCEHADWTGEPALFEELRDAVEAMLGWIDGPGDRDGDGLLEYAARAPHGLRNQGWKDSPDGVPDERGTPLEPPIALVEPQGYALRAKQGLARLFALAGEPARADALRAEAAALGARLERFWLPDRRHYSIGFGAGGRPSEALASNQGHLLWARAVPPGRARAVRDAVMADAMFSGWGIRTLAATEAGYNPLGYHLGTVWPHDTAMIACGLREYGFDADFDRLFAALLDAAAALGDHRLPELFAGYARSELDTPVPYPVACRPQAWAAGALPCLTTAALGLAPDALERRLHVRRPALPQTVNRLDVRNLRVAGVRIDLRFEREHPGGPVALADAHAEGDVEVLFEPAVARPTSA